MPRTTLPLASAKPTLHDVRRMLVHSNADLRAAGRALVIVWVRRPKRVTRRTEPARRAWIGTVQVSAPGYRTRTMSVDRCELGTRLA